ncbi:hybrid sensor histidine kinase/response regulator [Thermodesulforhabdus norvegica]|uniref:histidine kinase n=1 Tax=Thermodesulforhabdus norvegica TaxID=39841 RepID=A0A1I4UUI8_9BACT|nr:response regulator [Thermodesulforhabdus norvegica]SFM92642.1 two-component system, chemotaxis family, sensor kinase CheA [Thermodesulforhabdus norvegica]
MQDDQLMAALLEAFREEARERLEALYSFAEALESGDLTREKVDEAYREAHSLKGAARAVGLTEVVRVCQELESFIGRLKDDGEREPQEVARELYRFIKEIESGIYGWKAASGVSQGEAFSEGAVEKDRGGFFEEGETSEGAVALARTGDKVSYEPLHEPTETVRVNVRRLDVLLRRAEEFIPIKLASSQYAGELKKLYWFLEDVKSRRGDDPDLSYVESVLQRLVLRVESTSRQLDILVEDLLDRAKDLLMQPFSVLFQGMGRMVRELAGELGKEVVFTVDGEDIEIDRRILEELRDPMIHLLRNAVDHGIEVPEERVRRGKDRQGRVGVLIRREEARKVSLVVRDDGRGISVKRVREKALELGLLQQSRLEGMDDFQVLQFIFYPGFSTSPSVTELSGRGLGMSIVKEKIESVGGSVSVSSKEGFGTEFIIELPVSLATFRGILVRDLGRRFVVPTHSVDAVVRLEESDHRALIGGVVSVKHNGQIIPVQRLGAVLGLDRPRRREGDSPSVLLVISASGVRAGFLVEEVITEQEGLIKGLGPHLKSVPFVWAATVLGSGEVVPVLNPGDLVRSLQEKPVAAEDSGEYDRGIPLKRKNILVVEDSITSRTLLKNILEASGFGVITAVDGLEALSLLENYEIDLVVSDVEMPRMNGIELTRRIRASEGMRNLPVILVTGLDSPEDRERGLEAGADAYIVKTDFRQTTLLEVIRRYL